jgi:hypothetical protein
MPRQKMGGARHASSDRHAVERNPPLFKADSANLTVSASKDGKLRVVYGGWDDAKVVQPDGCGQARRGWKGGILPPGEGSEDPPSKTRTPLRPPVFLAVGAPLACVEPCILRHIRRSLPTREAALKDAC